MATANAPQGWLEDFRSIGNGENGKTGVIFVHGFTGSPASMRPWAEYFQIEGYTVSVPQLPGHGTHWENLNKVSWQQWPAKVLQELIWLRSHCSKVFIFGLSMGGCTTLNVVESEHVDGIVLVNPMSHIPGIQIKFAPIIALFKKGMPSVGDDIKKPGTTEWGYDVLPTRGVLQLQKMLLATRANLKKVTVPLLIFHSQDDHVLPVSNTNIIMSEIGTPIDQISRVELSNSYHVATLDYDAQIIFERSLQFVKSK
jgi:carboxylesterase